MCLRLHLLRGGLRARHAHHLRLVLAHDARRGPPEVEVALADLLRQLAGHLSQALGVLVDPVLGRVVRHGVVEHQEHVGLELVDGGVHAVRDVAADVVEAHGVGDDLGVVGGHSICDRCLEDALRVLLGHHLQQLGKHLRQRWHTLRAHASHAIRAHGRPVVHVVPAMVHARPPVRVRVVRVHVGRRPHVGIVGRRTTHAGIVRWRAAHAGVVRRRAAHAGIVGRRPHAGVVAHGGIIAHGRTAMRVHVRPWRPHVAMRRPHVLGR
mmetsp:Transcript_17689/g.44522  ORF Transcript_17689/g.44522 Transcript_17689/m.44522 type:complete len:266 (+) Transcript_17689:2416-3213(+)